MVPLILCLFVVPLLLGFFIKTILPNHYFCPAFFFGLGFLVMVAEFALVCYPALYMKTSFHYVCYIASKIFVLESIAIIIWFFCTKLLKQKSLFNQSKLLKNAKSPFFWFMIILCGYQILRILLGEPSSISDSKSYNALINDILQSDHLFMVNPENGLPLESLLDMPIKFFLSTWYVCIAMLAKLSHMHPLIITNTVLPGFLLLLHYSILYSLGFILFGECNNHVFQFTFVCSFIYELTLYCHTPTLIKLVWPAWGKGVLSMTVVPAIFVLYMLYIERSGQTKGLSYTLILFLIVLAGCSMSTMAAVVLPLELGILGLVWSMRNRSFQPLICSVISMIPAVLYVFIYYYLSRL